MKNYNKSYEWAKANVDKIRNAIMESRSVVMSLPNARAGRQLMYELQGPYEVNGTSTWRLGRTAFKVESTGPDKLPFSMIMLRESQFGGPWKLYISPKTNDQALTEEEINFLKWKQKWLPKEILEAFRKQGDTSEKTSEEIMVICKFFNASGAGTWWCYEYEEKEEIMWAYVNLIGPEFAECGTVSLKELASIKGMFGLGIERDRSFEPKLLSEIIKEVEAKI